MQLLTACDIKRNGQGVGSTPTVSDHGDIGAIAMAAKRITLHPSPCPDCGKIRHTKDRRLIGRRCVQCTCRTHGMPSDHPLYRCFMAMKVRCGYSSYRKPRLMKRYADRGITICQEWLADRGAFFRWAQESGWKPGLSIDRIDNDGPYAPWNCRWVTALENNRNRPSFRTWHKLSVEQVREIKTRLANGDRPTDIARDYPISYYTVRNIATGRHWKEVSI